MSMRKPGSGGGESKPRQDELHGNGMKLKQFIAHAGITSRRKAEEFIREGRVTINGSVVKDVTARVNESKDHVKVDGSLIRQEAKIYIVMNKPEGCITTVSDDKGRPTVVDLLKPTIRERIYPVGRLDFNTTGTLMLTNDGDFANSVRISSFALNRLKKGVKIGDERRFVRPADAGLYKRNDANDVIYIVIREGMNHQVKKMIEAVGASVVRLRRENVGKISDRGLSAGQWRYLTPDEIKYFKRGK
jgi:23S rRNA pseudouridine2605 synthase